MKTLAIFGRDVRVALRQFIMVWIMAAPIALINIPVDFMAFLNGSIALVLKMKTPGRLRLGLCFAF